MAYWTAEASSTGTAVTAGLYYVYRTSSVLNLRVFMPVAGKGARFNVPLRVYTAVPDGQGGYTRGSEVPGPGGAPLSDADLFGVQEAAAISASPYLELRYVYLFWAP